MTRYKITGVDVHGKRFKAIHTDCVMHAMMINLYRGHVWVYSDNGWRIIKSVWN